MPIRETKYDTIPVSSIIADHQKIRFPGNMQRLDGTGPGTLSDGKRICGRIIVAGIFLSPCCRWEQRDNIAVIKQSIQPGKEMDVPSIL
jgi:hypothetical protein